MPRVNTGASPCGTVGPVIDLTESVLALIESGSLLIKDTAQLVPASSSQVCKTGQKSEI